MRQYVDELKEQFELWRLFAQTNRTDVCRHVDPLGSHVADMPFGTKLTYSVPTEVRTKKVKA